MNLKNIDSISKLLIAFIIFLIFLFFYLFSVYANIKQYEKSYDYITKLQVLDKEFDNFLLHQSTFRNYDAINKKIEKFDITLQHLEKESKEETYTQKTKDEIYQIRNSFEEKVSDINYFKSLNASLLNNIHFLYDLQQTLALDTSIPNNILVTINETLFFLLQRVISPYMDKDIVSIRLERIKNFTDTYQHTFLHNFYNHSKIMQENFTLLHNLKKAIYHENLYKAIIIFHDNLHVRHNKNIMLQKIIATLFFLSAIVILLIVLKMHFHSFKARLELQAFKYAIENSDNSVVMTDPDRHITYVNDVFTNTSGYSKEEAIGKNPSILKSGEQEQNFYDEMNITLNRGDKWEGEFVNKRKDGSLYYEKASIVPVYLDKKLINYLAIKLDITKYVEQRMRLEQSASVFENTEEAIFITDKDNKLISINNAFTNIMGYTEDDVLGKNPKVLSSYKHTKIFYTSMWNHLIDTGLWRGKIYNKAKSGEIIPFWMTIRTIKDKKGQITNYTAVQTDLRELESTQAQADFLAYHDSLTELPNRTNLEGYLKHAIKMAKRNNTMLAILFIDLDRFKIINDSLGHDVGDEILKSVSSSILNVVRETDLLARWGGDEFVLVLESITDTNSPAHIASKILEQIKKPINVGSHHLNITASIGIALYPENGSDMNTIIRHADSAMYHAKYMGKNNFQYYTKSLSIQSQRKLSIDLEMQTCIENAELFLVFQPQYTLNDKKIIAVETLLRWNNQKLGIIPPDEFISIAEENGMIIPIGLFVFQEACKAFEKLQKAGIHLESIAINVSSIQFQDKTLLKQFLSIAKEANVNPKSIEIEITERCIMQQTEYNISILNAFREEGFKISIDDFGTGYSSMSYLKQLPLDTIKIDKSFIDDITDKNQTHEVVTAIIALSKSLGYTTIAEGIETTAQEDFLSKQGRDIGQGYLFSKPIEIDYLIQKFSS